MAVSPGLTAALKKHVLTLEDDLRQRVESQPDVHDKWRREYDEAITKHRTSTAWQAWRDDRVTQAAVAWVLTTVFIRFCEDNALLGPVWFAGPGDRRAEAVENEHAFYRANPTLTDLAWVQEAVNHLTTVPATRDLVEAHSPLWSVSPSGEAAGRLRQLWREQTTNGDLVWDFTDPNLSTRFLGDLYQDLSEHAKSTYALLQTPVFVEEFILDHTLEPALADRPLDGFRVIDPTCGSGHFLLGAFDRLLERWAQHDPTLDSAERTRRALAAVHGVDLNPFAVAIARFRLLVAALKATGHTSLETMPHVDLNLAAGDSLLHGRGTLAEGFDELGGDADRFGYATEDLDALWTILKSGTYDAVVGNPPYITVKDKQLNQRYRALYRTCKGRYALTAPFMERFFDLARRDGDRPAGWVGQITSNSFMKREFGSKLIEDFLPRQDLRLIIDTSGAYIPGHGTPTVILIGRHASPTSNTLRAILGKRGEPGQPENPAQGSVWSSIVKSIDKPGSEDGFVSSVDVLRSQFERHPWSLSGGGAIDLTMHLQAHSAHPLSSQVESIGFMVITGEDAIFVGTGKALPHWRRESRSLTNFVEGEGLRDFAVTSKKALYPSGEQDPSTAERSFSYWPRRTQLKRGLAFGQTRENRGQNWFDYILPNVQRMNSPHLIAFAFLATHNHFIMTRGGDTFNHSAPVIKLPEGATEDEHLELLGVLNSSTACFWLKQNSHDKGNGGYGGGIASTEWERFFEFTGTTLKDFPLPSTLPRDRGRRLDGLGQRLASYAPAVIAAGTGAPGTSMRQLDVAHVSYRSIREKMISEQEELDWECYGLYGLLDENLTYPGKAPHVRLGERAFEIALARRVAARSESSAWFERHGSTPVTEIPERWPEDYRALVQRRLDLIESNRFINLLERPEYKRRWAMEPWDKQVDRALRGWLLDRLEDRRYWFDAQGRPVARSVAQVADLVERADAVLVEVLRLWAKSPGATVTSMLSSLLATEGVPFLAAYRYKDSGLRKREAWEATWDLQRREDAGEDVGVIPVPPKYATADFRKPAYWSHRGKLDVPKERFILYPAAGRPSDTTELLGWAGWDHAQQALALATIIGEREQDGWADDALVPLVAGLVELAPWVRQWHDEPDPVFGLNLADVIDEEIRRRSTQVGKTPEELRAWRPPAARRGRKTAR